MQENTTHVVAVAFVVVMDVAMVMEVWRMPRRVVCFEVFVVSELVVWCDGRDGHRSLRLQTCMGRVHSKMRRRLDLDLKRLVAGVEPWTRAGGGWRLMIMGVVMRVGICG